MTTATIDAAVLSKLRQRRNEGEGIGFLAREVGMSWQRLWGLLYPKGAETPALAASGEGPLVERYRPRRLSGLWGQDNAVRILKRFVSEPFSTGFLFEGETGTGKTSAALALAAELGCDVKQEEFGGLMQVASGEQTADTIRSLWNRMWLRPACGSGWKVVVLNEADRMYGPVETIWLDRLESLPRRTVVVFTTNNPDKLSRRFRDRCARVTFESGALVLGPIARKLATRIWEAEAGGRPTVAQVEAVVETATEDGQLSFRALLQTLAKALMERA